MFLRLRNMYTLGASLRPRVFHARLVPPGTVPFSTSLPRRASTQPQQKQPQAQTEPTEPVQKSFTSLGSLLHPNTLKAITVTPYKHVHMSPVQEKVLEMMPELVDTDEGKDLLVRAKTGTGKTLAFLVPGIERRVRTLERLVDEELGKQEDEDQGQRGDGSFFRARMIDRLARETMGVLVISPTRELATQIAVSASNLSLHHADKKKAFGVQLLVGGESRGGQMREWVSGRKDVVVGTPGRLKDLLEGWNWQSKGAGGVQLGLKEVFGKSGDCVVVLDEADTLLDMGFRSDVDSIVGNLMRGRGAEGKQTWMFSATVGRGVESIVRESMRKDRWEYIDCVGQSDEKDVHSHVRQVHTVIGDGGGMGAFVHFLRLIVHDQLSVMKRNRNGEKAMRSKMLVFFSTTKMTKLFGKLLRACVDRGLVFPFKKLRVYEMHSKKEMNDRVKISREFRERPIAEDEAVVMVTSDVSARGVDYPGVGRVVQMGIPGNREGYVHRVGRTGRGDVKEGRGDLVLAPWEMGFLKVLGDVGMEPVTVEGLKTEIEELAAELGGQGKGDLTKSVARIEDVARSVANAEEGQMRVTVYEDEYRAAWASMVGFYVGSWDALRLGGLDDAIAGSGRWVEALGGLEEGSLVAGPGSGLPRGVLDRLKKTSERGGRGRGGKERAWGSKSSGEGREWGWNKMQEGRSQSGGWNRDQDRNARPSWNKDGDTRPRWNKDGDTRPSWNKDGDARPSWNRNQDRDTRPARGRQDGNSRPSWSRNQDGNSRSSWGRNQEGGSRPEGRSRSEEGGWSGQGAKSRSERFGGWLAKTEGGELETKGGTRRATPSWMGRGSAKGKRSKSW